MKKNIKYRALMIGSEVFHLGPQKTATTWVYQCLSEHPEVVCSISDTTHFFSMFYHRGWDWYDDQFSDGDGIRFDPTPNYFRSPLAPQRIAESRPDARLIVCFREPMERTFSHYWHEKKKGRFDYQFEEIFDNYDLYASFVEPSLYALNLGRYLEWFSREQILVLFFEDLQKHPDEFVRQIFEFMEIDTEFRPSVLNRKVNSAGPPQSGMSRKLGGALRGTPLFSFAKGVKRGWDRVTGAETRIERLEDVSPAVLRDLRQTFSEDVDRLEGLLDLDFQPWRRVWAERIGD